MKKIGDKDPYGVPEQPPVTPIRCESSIWDWLPALIFAIIWFAFIPTVFKPSINKMTAKPIHVKPNLYTYMMEEMKIIAKNHGYNLLVHGSMNRDLDLIAVPWVDDPKPEIELIQSLSEYLTGYRRVSSSGDDSTLYQHSMLPGGRSNYVIQMARQGEWNCYEKDLQYYLDISVTPLVKHE